MVIIVVLSYVCHYIYCCPITADTYYLTMISVHVFCSAFGTTNDPTVQFNSDANYRVHADAQAKGTQF